MIPSAPGDEAKGVSDLDTLTKGNGISEVDTVAFAHDAEGGFGLGGGVGQSAWPLAGPGRYNADDPPGPPPPEKLPGESDADHFARMLDAAFGQKAS